MYGHWTMCDAAETEQNKMKIVVCMERGSTSGRCLSFMLQSCCIFVLFVFFLNVVAFKMGFW